METLVAEPGATVETSQAGDQTSAVVQNDGGSRTSGAAAQVRANGTVVLTPAQVKHVGIPSVLSPLFCLPKLRYCLFLALKF